MMNDMILASDVSTDMHRPVAKGNKPHNRQAQLCREELDVVCHALSHSLRGPLRSIEGFSQVLLDSLCEKLDEQAAENFHRVIKASNEMGCLLDGLLQLTRVTRHPLRPERIDLSDLARCVVAKTRSLHPEKKIRVTVAPGLSAWGDRLLLKLALEHLFENAWKFSRPQSSPEICMGGDQGDAESVFYVYDNGIGFDMTYYHKLFGVFERLHNLPDVPGCGIGLATVKRIFQRHNGTVWANGIPDLGACFWFNLPNHGTHETTTLHLHDRGQRKRRDARKDRSGATANQV